MPIHRLALAAVLAASLTGASWAQEGTGDPGTEGQGQGQTGVQERQQGRQDQRTRTTEGVVRTYDEERQVLVISAEGQDIAFDTTGANLPDDLKAGQRVRVEYVGSEARSVTPAR